MALSLKIKDVRGQQFGVLSVSTDAVPVSRPSNSAKPSLGAAAYWPATCKCGATVWARGSALGKATISCGSEKCQIEALTALNRPLGKDLAFTSPPVGQVFGHLVVLGLSPQRHADGRRVWTCQCKCGTVKDQIATRIVNGEIRSCGCELGRSKQRAAVTKYVDPLRKCWNDVLRRYKDKAKERGLTFEITADEFFQLVKLPCRYCGRVGTREKSYDAWHPTKPLIINCNGIDRLNSAIGYVIGNCVPCCQTCNVMKLRMSEKDFISHVQLILKNFTANR